MNRADQYQNRRTGSPFDNTRMRNHIRSRSKSPNNRSYLSKNSSRNQNTSSHSDLVDSLQSY